jgi:hypothetical protein
MSIQLVTPPAEEPVTLIEAKLHLRVDFDDDDTLIASLITAARQAAETLTGRQFITARWKQVLDCFPGPSLMGVPAGQTFTLPGHAILLSKAPVQSVVSKEEILAYQRVVRRLPIADAVTRYAVKLVRTTRPGEGAPDYVKQFVSYGASVRAAQALVLGAKARALLQGRASASFDDVRALARPVLRHRVLVNFTAQSEKVTTDSLIGRLLESVPLPRSSL